MIITLMLAEVILLVVGLCIAWIDYTIHNYRLKGGRLYKKHRIDLNSGLTWEVWLPIREE